MSPGACVFDMNVIPAVGGHWTAQIRQCDTVDVKVAPAVVVTRWCWDCSCGHAQQHKNLATAAQAVVLHLAQGRP